MHGVGGTHGVSECMKAGLIEEEQVFENGKMWLAADGSLCSSSLANAYVKSGGQRHRLVCCTFMLYTGYIGMRCMQDTFFLGLPLT